MRSRLIQSAFFVPTNTFSNSPNLTTHSRLTYAILPQHYPTAYSMNTTNNVNQDYFDDEDNIDDNHPLSNQEFAHPSTLKKQNHNFSNSWYFRSHLAPLESEKQFLLFSQFIELGRGRSLSYVSTICNIPFTALQKISKNNNWEQRASDYDLAQLQHTLEEANTTRQKLHLQKLEEYRQQQEYLGKQLSVNAAKIASIANNTLTTMLDNNGSIDIRDLPSILTTAAKLATVGKELQSASLGVEQLLTAIEEVDAD